MTRIKRFWPIFRNGFYQYKSDSVILHAYLAVFILKFVSLNILFQRLFQSCILESSNCQKMFSHVTSRHYRGSVDSTGRSTLPVVSPHYCHTTGPYQPTFPRHQPTFPRQPNFDVNKKTKTQRTNNNQTTKLSSLLPHCDNLFICLIFLLFLLEHTQNSSRSATA